MKDNNSKPTPVEKRRVCAKCIGEEYLVDLITKANSKEVCSYCDKTAPTIPMPELGEHVERAIRQFYELTASEPDGYEYYLQRESGEWDRSGEPITDVIAEILEADDEIAKDVREVISDRTGDLESAFLGEEQPFDEDAHYAEAQATDHSKLSAEYHRFEEIVTERARYFSPEARQILSSLFGQLEGMRTTRGRPLIVEAGPDLAVREFFRARVFQDDELLKRALTFPDQELGPPPARVGRAGRLNAAGVSIFYGADNAAVALAEVRPPVGSRVVIARFELLRRVRLLDINALESLLVKGSLFDPEHMIRLRHAAFLDSFSARFTRPVMPEHEVLEYIPTQAIADYLAQEVSPPLDGILYTSAQSESVGGKNVALFHKSSRVEQLVRPAEMTSDVSFGHYTEEGFEQDYSVYETEPKSPAKRSARRLRHVIREIQNPIADRDIRTPALRMDENSLTVHHVRSVEVHSDAHSVTRIRDVRGNVEI